MVSNSHGHRRAVSATRRYASIFHVSIALAAICCAGPAMASVLFQDDFSSGNPANSSDYTLVPLGTLTTQGNYRVVNNPANPTFQNNYGSFYDHTLGTTAGEMLFFDGSSNSSDRIYYHAASLTAGVAYTFSYYQAADNLGSPPVLGAYVNNGTADTLLTTYTNTSTQTWAPVTAVFTPPTTGNYVFSIRDANTVASFNDGAVDDVQLASVPEPASGVLLLGGTAMTALNRRRRA